MKPHDVTDLYLAPVLLALDARIEQLGEMEAKARAEIIALDSDSAAWSPEDRVEGLRRALGQPVELHSWHLDITERGLRVSNGRYHVVLGLPASLWEYIARG